jgi:hypothetical protein
LLGCLVAPHGCTGERFQILFREAMTDASAVHAESVRQQIMRFAIGKER